MSFKAGNEVFTRHFFFLLPLSLPALTSNLNFTIEMHLATAHKYHLKRTLSCSVLVLSDFLPMGQIPLMNCMFEQIVILNLLFHNVTEIIG